MVTRQLIRRPTPAGDLPLEQYELFALSNHHGILGGGHYVAYVRAHSEQWYHCNDIMSPQIIEDPTTVLQHQAYMLIYERT